ncbi:MAG: phosphoglycerate dehydrogenase [Lachnospiraceae bacterium]|nr:phosphoglycerate dehydrogenase [Lachnospiraceae bacterium]
MKILVTPTSLQPGKNDAALAPLQAFADELVFNPTGKPLAEEDLIPLLKDCDGFVAGLDSITARVMEACPNLKVISRYGAGYDRVDIEAAKRLGIKVTNTPGVNAQAVGELAFGLILAAARKIPYLNAQTRNGAWVRSTGMELKGKTLGILGLGAIGKVVANCAQGFGMHVLAYDPYINEAYCKEHQIEAVSFEELMSRANVVSLHLPLLDSTYHLIDAEAIRLLPDQAIIVNASRGGIIDEDAAYDALRTGKLSGLALDAFETEPPTDSRLFEFDNVIATPHTGAHTKEATDNMAHASIQNLIDLLSGKDCPSIVNR